jgi:hypothetical protein
MSEQEPKALDYAKPQRGRHPARGGLLIVSAVAIALILLCVVAMYFWLQPDSRGISP